MPITQAARSPIIQRARQHTPDPGVHDGRSRCSRCPDPDVHDVPIPVFTIDRFPQGRSIIAPTAN
jgi:hypothetical protein